jgi:hypothetical protein
MASHIIVYGKRQQPEGLEFADINGKVTLEDFMDGIPPHY